MPRPRFSKLPVLRQREILERAAQEFAACGYEHASLNHIIDALGLNKGVFYYNFDSKADLFAAVVQMVGTPRSQQKRSTSPRSTARHSGPASRGCSGRTMPRCASARGWRALCTWC